jgi:hypothetical protein
MKQKTLACLCAPLFFFSLCSCVTKTRYSSYSNYPETPFYFVFETGKVAVTADHVNESVVAEQIHMIAETYLKSNQLNDIKADKKLIIDITVAQRSFMYNVELYNTIYVSCVIRDETGFVYGGENEYISGKRTIIAVPEQNAIITRVLKRILKSQQARYKDIQRYLEQAEIPETNET